MLITFNGELLALNAVSTQTVVRSEHFRRKAAQPEGLEVGQDEDKEIGIGRVATIGLLTGPVYQIFESMGRWFNPSSC